MKTVLITGGTGGIGKALVEAFASEGYSVAFTFNSSFDKAMELQQQTGALAVKMDLSNESEINSAALLIKEKLGEISVLINNAGVSSFSLFGDLTYEVWRKTFSVNVDGAFLLTKAVLPDMISRKWGRIINISSIWGQVGASCEVHYSSSKAALIGLTKALAKELGPSGITVNAIAPGLIDTEMNSSLSKEDVNAFVEETPLMRMGKPEEVAKAALFLASDDAAFITGDVMKLSGGYVV